MAFEKVKIKLPKSFLLLFWFSKKNHASKQILFISEIGAAT
jgi:hypothetical protein